MTRYLIVHEGVRHVVIDKDARCIDAFEYMKHQSNQVNVDTVCGRHAYGYLSTDETVTCLSCLTA